MVFLSAYIGLILAYIFKMKTRLLFPAKRIRLLIQQFFCFALVGGVGTIAHYTVLILLVSGLGLNPVLGSTVGFLAGMVINYSLNRAYTFSSYRAHREAFWRFGTVALLGMGINASAMAFFNMALGLHYLLAQIMATALALGWNFLGSRNWVFVQRF